VAFNRSDVYTFGGVISGAGSLRKSGSGTLILTNTNTYTGGTTIATGTLQLGDGTSAGAVSGDITNNGALIFATPASGQGITGAISGSGRITKVGAGTLVMTGANTNAGGTTIAAGTLQIGDGGTTGSITGNVIDDSALVFKRSDNVSFAGTITGAGRIEQAGTGTLTLATNVSNALVATSGRVVVGATSTFTGDLTTAQAGRVDNGGGTLHIAKLDNGGILSGTSDLTGSFLNRATGDIRLAAGQSMFVQSSLPGTNAGLLEALGNASSQATFETNGPFTNAAGGSGMIAARYATLRFDAGLTNQGALSMNYGLTDVFGKVNNVTGGAITIAGGGGATFYDDVVQNGSLVVSAAGGTRSSAVFLGSFSGSGGFTGGGDVFIMGDLRPGNSPAEVTYDGNVYLSPSTHLVMELGGERSGGKEKMDVTGSLGLGGGLSVVLYDGFVPSLGDHFDLFDASSVTGRFDSTTLPELPEGLAWDTTNLYSSGTIGVTPEPATISLLALAGAAMLGRRKRRV
jgi:autotransporter-associated beta strand protein